MLIIYGVLLSLNSMMIHETMGKESIPGKYEYQGNPTEYDEVNIYFVPHSHTDPGWIDTLQKYYDREVRDILYNVFMQLSADPQKRFTWAEICYLKQFYEEMQDTDMRDIIHEVVESGQMEIVGGGWVQHDETLSTYR